MTKRISMYHRELLRQIYVKTGKGPFVYAHLKDRTDITPGKMKLLQHRQFIRVIDDEGVYGRLNGVRVWQIVSDVATRLEKDYGPVSNSTLWRSLQAIKTVATGKREYEREYQMNYRIDIEMKGAA